MLGPTPPLTDPAARWFPRRASWLAGYAHGATPRTGVNRRRQHLVSVRWARLQHTSVKSWKLEKSLCLYEHTSFTGTECNTLEGLRCNRTHCVCVCRCRVQPEGSNTAYFRGDRGATNVAPHLTQTHFKTVWFPPVPFDVLHLVPLYNRRRHRLKHILVSQHLYCLLTEQSVGHLVPVATSQTKEQRQEQLEGPPQRQPQRALQRTPQRRKQEYRQRLQTHSPPALQLDLSLRHKFSRIRHIRFGW